MAITVIGTAKPTVTSNNGTITLPAGIMKGDLIWVFIMAQGSGTSWAPPTGYTRIASANHIASAYRMADGTEGGTTVNYISSANGSFTAQVVIFRGAKYKRGGDLSFSSSSTPIAVSNENKYAIAWGYDTQNLTPSTGSYLGNSYAVKWLLDVPANQNTNLYWNNWSGDTEYLLMEEDQPPNVTPTSPMGSSTSPSFVKTLTPSLSWSVSDPDAGDTQGAYQVVVKRAADNVTMMDTGVVNSSSTSVVVPVSTALVPDTVYYWYVTVWDSQLLQGTPSNSQYFRTSHAPNAASLTPGNANSATPAGCSTTPTVSWSYSDGDTDAQSTYQVRVYNASTNLLTYDSGQVASASNSHAIPTGALGAGIKFYWNVTVWDTTNMSSTSANSYILTNTPPAPVTLVSPTDTYRVGLRPVFVANMGDDPENDKQNVKIQLADNSSFTVNLKEMSTATATTGWEAYNGTAWVAFPSGGIDSTFEGKQVRYTWQSDLTEGKTYYWRIAPIDGTTGTLGNWSSTRTVRVGDTLQFKLKNPTKTTAAAKKIVLTGVRKVATDGTTPSVLKVEVCNNGLDATPTWEDATAYFLNGQTYVFTNSAKTGTDWAVDCRVTITANDSLGAIEFDGLGYSFM